jgi:uncharacterized protein YggE
MRDATRRSLLAVLVCIGIPAAASAAEDMGITVGGAGTVKGHPAVVEIGARISGEGELAGDASVKFHDTKKKAIAALDALKDPNLSVEFEGPSVAMATDPAAQMRAMQGIAGTDAGKQKIQISEQARLVLKVPEGAEADKLLATVLKIIDAGKDAGLQMGPPPGNFLQMQIRAQTGQGDQGIAVFKIPDKSAIEGQAYEKAIADAKSKAERLAKLAGVKLGPVMSVQSEDVAPAKGGQSMIAELYGMGAGSAAEGDNKEVEAPSFGEIPVTARVVVKFAIVSAGEPGHQEGNGK